MERISARAVLKNFVLNFLSSALPTLVIQFIVQPIIARRLGSELNGQYLTLMSLNYFMISVTAAVLNTVRMLQDENYRSNGIQGDFNCIFVIYALILLVVMPVGYCFYIQKVHAIDVLLYLMVALLYLYHDYIFAQYRLRMQFSKILANNVILVVGYIVGIFVFQYWIPLWQIVYIIAYFMASIYDWCNTDFLKEPLKTTHRFRVTVKKIGSLTVANALSSSVSYFDKLLLYPILGGLSVSVYSTASLIGKMLLLVSGPLNSLLLSYLVKMNSMRLKITRKSFLIGTVALLGGYLCCVLVGYPLTSFLYPQWAQLSHTYIPIVVASNLFMLISNLLNTVLIRFYKMSFQMVLQGINVIAYISVSLALLYFWGLLGFSIGVALVAFAKMVALIVIVMRIRNSTSLTDDIKEPSNP